MVSGRVLPAVVADWIFHVSVLEPSQGTGENHCTSPALTSHNAAEFQWAQHLSSHLIPGNAQ